MAVHNIPFCHHGATRCLACLRKQSRCCFWNTVWRISPEAEKCQTCSTQSHYSILSNDAAVKWLVRWQRCLWLFDILTFFQGHLLTDCFAAVLLSLLWTVTCFLLSVPFNANAVFFFFSLLIHVSLHIFKFWKWISPFRKNYIRSLNEIVNKLLIVT